VRVSSRAFQFAYPQRPPFLAVRIYLGMHTTYVVTILIGGLGLLNHNPRSLQSGKTKAYVVVRCRFVDPRRAMERFAHRRLPGLSHIVAIRTAHCGEEHRRPSEAFKVDLVHVHPLRVAAATAINRVFPLLCTL
jgi:hypothetical protein